MYMQVKDFIMAKVSKGCTKYETLFVPNLVIIMRFSDYPLHKNMINIDVLHPTPEGINIPFKHVKENVGLEARIDGTDIRFSGPTNIDLLIIAMRTVQESDEINH